MNALKGLLAALIGLVATYVGVLVSVLLGYFIGVLIAITPFFNDLLGVNHDMIPVFTAWLGLLSFFISVKKEA